MSDIHEGTSPVDGNNESRGEELRQAISHESGRSPKVHEAEGRFSTAWRNLDRYLIHPYLDSEREEIRQSFRQRHDAIIEHVNDMVTSQPDEDKWVEALAWGTQQFEELYKECVEKLGEK